jgi:pimeloyl-ACP methyl ester carboxylesterase
LVVAITSGLGAQATSPTLLPPPTGPSSVGRITYDWVDSSRTAFLDPMDTARREILVDVWYPTTASGGAAGYLPYLRDFGAAMSDSLARRRFAPEYAAVEAGRLRTHATEGAPVRCPVGGCPLLIFSHGGGVDRSLYTAQYEELASYGYVIAAIAHTGDTHRVVFPGGRSIGSVALAAPADPPEWKGLQVWRREFARSVARRSQGRRVLHVEAADIEFVLDRMTRLAHAAASPFATKLDLRRVGALGHSAGGMAAALACQRDQRIRACLNQDGAMANLPFDRDSAGSTMTQPFMYLTRPYVRPTDSDSMLAVLEMTRAENDSLLNSLQFRSDTLLADMPAGAWRVTIGVPGMPHMGFSDESLIAADGDSVKTRRALEALRVTSLYTRAFFDKTLRGRRDTPLDVEHLREGSSATVERFAPRRHDGSSLPRHSNVSTNLTFLN